MLSKAEFAFEKKKKKKKKKKKNGGYQWCSHRRKSHAHNNATASEHVGASVDMAMRLAVTSVLTCAVFADYLLQTNWPQSATCDAAGGSINVSSAYPAGAGGYAFVCSEQGVLPLNGTNVTVYGRISCVNSSYVTANVWNTSDCSGAPLTVLPPAPLTRFGASFTPACTALSGGGGGSVQTLCVVSGNSAPPSAAALHANFWPANTSCGTSAGSAPVTMTLDSSLPGGACYAVAQPFAGANGVPLTLSFKYSCSGGGSFTWATWNASATCAGAPSSNYSGGATCVAPPVGLESNFLVSSCTAPFVSPSPSSNATASPSSNATASFSPTATASFGSSPSQSAAATGTPSVSPTAASSPPNTGTLSPSPLPTITTSTTSTMSINSTASPTLTRASPRVTPSSTLSIAPGLSPSKTATLSKTGTPLVTPTRTRSLSPGVAASVTPTVTRSRSGTGSGSGTVTGTPAPTGVTPSQPPSPSPSTPAIPPATFYATFSVSGLDSATAQLPSAAAVVLQFVACIAALQTGISANVSLGIMSATGTLSTSNAACPPVLPANDDPYYYSPYAARRALAPAASEGSPATATAQLAAAAAARELQPSGTTLYSCLFSFSAPALGALAFGAPVSNPVQAQQTAANATYAAFLAMSSLATFAAASPAAQSLVAGMLNALSLSEAVQLNPLPPTVIGGMTFLVNAPVAAPVFLPQASPSTTPSPSTPSAAAAVAELSTGAIVGIAVGTSVAILLVAGGLFAAILIPGSRRTRRRRGGASGRFVAETARADSVDTLKLPTDRVGAAPRKSRPTPGSVRAVNASHRAVLGAVTTGDPAVMAGAAAAAAASRRTMLAAPLSPLDIVGAAHAAPPARANDGATPRGFGAPVPVARGGAHQSSSPAANSRVASSRALSIIAGMRGSASADPTASNPSFATAASSRAAGAGMNARTPSASSMRGASFGGGLIAKSRDGYG